MFKLKKQPSARYEPVDVVSVLKLYLITWSTFNSVGQADCLNGRRHYVLKVSVLYVIVCFTWSICELCFDQQHNLVDSQRHSSLTAQLRSQFLKDTHMHIDICLSRINEQKSDCAVGRINVMRFKPDCYTCERSTCASETSAWEDTARNHTGAAFTVPGWHEARGVQGTSSTFWYWEEKYLFSSAFGGVSFIFRDKAH